MTKAEKARKREQQKKAAAIDRELVSIAKRHKGVLNPHDVVDFARDPETALHDEFEWNDGEAAQKWRLHQARNLIRVRVIEHPSKGTETIRAWVSLTPDRKPQSKGGGYRSTSAVVGHEEMRQIWYADAMGELQRVRMKYQQIKDLLAPVWAAMDALTAKKAQRKKAA